MPAIFAESLCCEQLGHRGHVSYDGKPHERLWRVVQREMRDDTPQIGGAAAAAGPMKV